ncbi:RNA ligase family protein [Dactylosporangium sp. AC04546]|uniref:RNA ligase family protein n=1 Tax=Dactylosporangium sp. AC04546 TaxID=2862460 RepID=UPI001EDD388D|nr:RNA ligase family protein [Dactylosporangium sp. AC04546]WVK87792.1 RNA ligase family protein [Dactylosporangium sp. AC04546]
MEHLAYPKILSGQPVAIQGPWIATEKLHGANLVIAGTEAAITVGKRKAWLRPDEAFFGWQLLRPAFERAVAVALEHTGKQTVRLYGELYGGHYPHADVPAVPGASPVQTGVWYAPDIRFALFDVLAEEVFVRYDDVAAIAGSSGLDVVPLLARGPRSTVDATPARFQTRMPAVHHLPAIDGNLAEGIVLRPDAAVPFGQRPSLKVKIAEFDEVRYGGSQPWDPHAFIGPEELRRLAERLVNPPRLAGARSKVGPGDPGALADEVVLDVLVDLTDAFPAAMAALSEADQHRLETALRARIAP